MEDINLFDIKKCWGNFVFDYVFSESNGFSGGILCIWNPTVFNKYSTTVSDYFIIVRGKWISNGKLLLIISVYAPQEALEKKMLWDYLNHIIISWKGEVILMGDFNEVRYKNERYGSVFNVQGAKVFNSFIANSNLVEVPLGGCSYTWCHGSASKMSKLDRFLMSERLLRESPSISATTLDRVQINCNNMEVATKGEGRLGKALIRSWDYLHDVLRKFGFGDRWCGWIYECLRTSRGSVLVNGSPTEEFQFFKGLKQGDPLAPFLFILVMESLHISFNRVVEAGLFQVGGSMSRVNAWDDIVDKLVVRLSKWKMKTLSIGGRLTLLKSVLGAMSIYHMSIFKVPMKVLHRMESIRSRFFNGVELNSKKAIWVKWCKVLASKDKGGLGVSSLFALHGDMAVWYWVLKVFHKSIWCAIVREEHAIKCKDLTLVREEELEQFQMGELTRCLMLLFLGIWMIDGAGTLDGVGFFGCFGSKSFG
ncbi:RNA-directed DNA polymerase, eukaryota, reverse transcriptase zinc-binding domain protein [Tanacetum coccineum]